MTDRHHFIRAQRIRKFVRTQTGDSELAELAVSDPRNLVMMTRAAHEREHWPTTLHTREEIPASVEEFAADWGLEWSLDRDYGEREVAA